METMREPRTEAGRRLVGRQELMRERGTRGLFSVNLGDVFAIEDEARDAALTEVEEAVKGLPTFGLSDAVVLKGKALAAISSIRQETETP